MQRSRSSRPPRSTPLLAGRLAALLLLGACAVGPDYERPQAPLPPAYRYAEPPSPPPESARREDWWAAFGDPGLEAVVLAARAHNHELRAGLARLEQARALIGIAGAEGLPQLALEPSLSRLRSSDEVELFNGITNGRTQTTYTVPLTLSWELDLFGRVRRSREAARAEAEASAADFDALLLAIETEAATRYLEIRALDLELAAVARGIETRRDGAELVRKRFELGAVSELDVARAEGQLAQGEADRAQLERQRSAREHALAVLAGEPASDFALEPRPLEGAPPRVPAGLPSELLRARPDLRRAERALAAANARVGVATAAFYPSLTLTGDVGWQATDAGDLFLSSARIWAIRPALYLPLFQGGRNQAELARARARYEEVVEDYQQTVLVALSEVESALAARRFLADESAGQARAVEAAQRARDLSRTQYELGSVDYLVVLDAERTALETQRAQARLLGEQYLDALALVRALGGRW